MPVVEDRVGAGVGRARCWAAMAVLCLALYADYRMIGIYFASAWMWQVARAGIGALATLAIALLIRPTRRQIGLRLGADPSWPRLIGWGLVAVGIFVVLYAGALTLVAFLGPGLAALHIERIMPEDRGQLFFSAVLVAPLVEEPLYRFALCPAAEATIGRRAGIALSGIVFGLLHVVYGHPSPANVLGGFFLGWIYYRSRSMLVPALAHGLGNGILNLANYAVLDWIIRA